MTYVLATPPEQIAPVAGSTALVPWVGIPADRNPALVYLAGLAAGSRRTMRQALNMVAGILTAGRCDLVTLPWSELRFQHTQAVRAALQEKYNAATANKMLAALPRVLRCRPMCCSLFKGTFVNPSRQRQAICQLSNLSITKISCSVMRYGALHSFLYEPVALLSAINQ